MIKLVFSYGTSTPTLSAISPVTSTATNSQSTAALSLDGVLLAGIVLELAGDGRDGGRSSAG